MSRKILVALIVFFITTEVKAQGIAVTSGPNGVSGTMIINNCNNPAFSSTAQEGWLRGLSSAWSGVGNYLQSLGVYENLHEQARRQYLQNEYNRIQGRWSLKDQAEARKKAAHKDFITMEHEKLDRIVRLAELNKRKEEMIKAGLLPKPKKPVFRWKGQEYAGYEEFKKSPAYQEMLVESAKKTAEYQAKKEQEESKRLESIELMRKYRQLSPVDWHLIEQRQRAAEILAK